MRPERIPVIVLALAFSACLARTDQQEYETGETGEATFENSSDRTLYLGGCNHFDYEKRVGRKWVSQGSDLICVWEGLAQPVPPGGEVVDPIRAREPGLWRLHYAVGTECREDAPLSPDNCEAIRDVYSNRFEVVESGCVVSGCSGEICADEAYASICIWREEFICYRDARCGPFGPKGTCAWEPTPELDACLEEHAGDPGGSVPLP